MIKIALIGAGYTLERVAKLLSPDDFVVTSRSHESGERFRNLGYNNDQVDVADPAQVTDFFMRHPYIETIVDGVPPLAAATHEIGKPTDGVCNIIKGAAEASLSIRRLIYLSTTGVYGVGDGSWVDEQHPEQPQTERGKNRLASESFYREAFPSSCALRIAAIYGPKRGIGHSLKAQRYPYIDDGARWSNRIHVEDLSAVIVRAIEYVGDLPRAINVADDLPSLSRDVVEYYCKKFNFSFPQSISAEKARALGLETLLSNQRISNKLLKKIFKVDFQYPSYREGAESEFDL